MRDLLALAATNDAKAARQIADLLATSSAIARRDLNPAMVDSFGGTDAEGRWTQRDSFEMLEHALALHMIARPFDLNGFASIAHATAIMERLPTQTVRSEEQIDLQQFSTPVDIAAIVVLTAAITSDDVVLAPSAGNGLLVAQIPACASLQLNEIDPRRRERLSGIFPHAIVTGHDGAGLVSHHATVPRPTVVLIKPPFSRSIGRGADDLAAVRKRLPGGFQRRHCPHSAAGGGRLKRICRWPLWRACGVRFRSDHSS